MISKRIQPEQNSKILYTDKKSTANLIKYIENIETGKKTHKRWYINLPKDKDLAIVKMQNTQAMNTSTSQSKMYHYIVSFENSEKPNDQVMLDIEINLSQALGYQEYQRVISIHDNIEHYHMHVVINTIHPTKFINNNSPSNDYYIRDKKMRELEKKHSLSVNNGIEISRHREKQIKN